MENKKLLFSKLLKLMWTFALLIFLGNSSFAQSTAAEIEGFTFGTDDFSAATITSADASVGVIIKTSADITALTPAFTLSTGAQLSPTTTDFEVPTNFTSPKVYHVLAEDGVTEKAWTVSARYVYTGNDIVGASVPNQVGETLIDTYGRRVELHVMYDSAFEDPTFDVSMEASYAAAKSDSIKFWKVTAEDGSTADWRALLTHVAPATGNSITDIAVTAGDTNVIADLSNTDLDAVTIDKVNKSVMAYIMDGVDLAGVSVDFTVSQYAKVIMPDSPDWTDTVYVKVASQSKDTVEWMVVLMNVGVTAPDAPMVEAATLDNYMDSIFVKVPVSNLISYVALIMDGAEGDTEAASNNFKLMHANVPAGDTGAYVMTTNLVPGDYYAYAADAFMNISDKSTNKVVIDTAMVEVEKLSDLKALFFDVADMMDRAPSNMTYWFDIKYTGEAVISTTDDYNYRKYFQDGTGGMMIYDHSGVLNNADYKVGTKFTNLTGYISFYNDQLEIIPRVDNLTVISQDNEVTPTVITLKDLTSDHFAYQSELVTVQNVVFPDANGSLTFANGKSYYIQNYDLAAFDAEFWNRDYTGTEIPTVALNVTGVKQMIKVDGVPNIIPNGKWYPVLTARSLADFDTVTEPVVYFNKNALDFDDIYVDGSESVSVKLMNIGGGEMTVNQSYITGSSDFMLVNPAFNHDMATSDMYQFNVEFAPKVAGDKEATLIIQIDGQNYEIALSGTAMDIPEIPTFDLPYFTGFEDGGEGWNIAPFYIANYGFSYDGYVTLVAHNAAENGYAYSPYIDLSGALEPYAVFYSGELLNPGKATKTFEVSTDGVNWDVYNVPVGNDVRYGPYIKVAIPLTNYKDEVVQIRFGYNHPGTPGSNYWLIDDFKVFDNPSTPIFAAVPHELNFGSVNIGDPVNHTVSLENVGTSFLTIDKVTLAGTDAASFKLIDKNVYPYEVGFDGYELRNDDYAALVDVECAFTSVGEKSAMLVVEWTDPRLGAMKDTIQVMASSISCADAITAVLGDNDAPYAESWFEYTPSEDALLTISSCREGQFVDTDVKVYDACGGKLVAANDDDGVDCTGYGFTYSSTVVFAAHGGTTYKIQWLPTWDAAGFTFSIESEPLATAPVLTSVTASAMNNEQGQAYLSFEGMIMLEAAKSNSNTSTLTTYGKDYGKALQVLESGNSMPLASTKTFEPVGDPEVEPNEYDSPQPISLGTVDNPTQITGHFGVYGDADFFEFPVASVGYYFNVTLEIEAGAAEFWVAWYTDGGWRGWRTYVYPDEIGTFEYTLLGEVDYTDIVAPTDSLIIVVRRNSAEMSAVEEPGYGYNLQVWNSEPPSFSIYRNNYKIAGPTPMPFEYLDQGIDLNRQYCYAVTEQMNDGNESELSNSICVTAIPGTGDICSKAMPLEAGLTQAPRTPFWYAYTPTETKAVTLTSNIDENGDPSKEWNDHMLFIYANCDDATPLYENDDVENGVIRTSQIDFIANAGETYLINWQRWAAAGSTNAYNSEPFYFKLIETDLIEGDYVENAIPLTLPVVDMDGTTSGFNHNYDATNCGSIFMGGKDVCYSFTVPYGGKISGSIAGEWVGMNVIKGKPGSDACIAYAAGQTGGSFTGKAVMPGITYYVVISTQLPTEETDFVMNLSFTPDPKQTVTFNVDMNVPIAFGDFDPATDSVDIVGTFNFWNHTVNMTDDNSDGIYTYALPTEYFVGENILYKYRINADWNKAEFSNDVNVYRTYTVKSSNNVTNDMFDDLELPSYDVTFNVNMAKQVSIQAFDPATGKVTLKGSFTTATITTKDANGTYIYSYTVKGVSYGDITYQFLMDGVAETVSREAAIHNDTTITVWWNDEKLTDVKSKASASVSVYPNPANGMFTIDFGTLNTDKTTVEFVNVDGKVVNTIDMNSRSTITLDSKDYAKGVYYLRFNDGEQVGVQKVVIE